MTIFKTKKYPLFSMKVLLVAILLLQFVSVADASQDIISIAPREQLRLDGGDQIIIDYKGNYVIEIPNMHILDVLTLRFSIQVNQIIEGLKLELSLEYSPDFSDNHDEIDLNTGYEYSFSFDFSNYELFRNLEYLYSYDSYNQSAFLNTRKLNFSFSSLTELDLELDYSIQTYRNPFFDLDLNSKLNLVSRIVPSYVLIDVPSGQIGSTTVYLILPIQFLDFALDDDSLNDHLFIEFSYTSSLPIDVISFDTIIQTRNCKSNTICLDNIDVEKNYVIPFEIKVGSSLSEVTLQFEDIFLTWDPYYSESEYQFNFNRNGFLGLLVATMAILSFRIVDYGGFRKLQIKENQADSKVFERETRIRGGLEI